MPPSWQQPAAPSGYPASGYPANHSHDPQQLPWMYGEAKPPSAWPVAVFTLIFGIFGGISAGRRANRARAMGVGGARYWGTFAAVLAGNLLLIGLLVVVLVPVFLNVRETALTKDLESRIVSDSATDSATPAVKSADCTPVTRNSDGTRSYTCLIGFVDGRSQSFNIIVDAQRQWAVQE